jgi:adenosylcobinamide-GDP ribazoletransferase
MNEPGPVPTDRLRQELASFLGAIRFFTRLPVPEWVGHSADGLNRSARYFPAVGILIGLIAALVYLLTSIFWPKTLAVLLAMAATLYATGAFHEDGLADTADGLGGGWDKARILDIMKDSRVGSYGVVALVLALLGKFMLLVEMPHPWLPAALIGAHTVSRFCATALLHFMDYVREDASAKAKPLATRLSLPGLVVAAACVFLILPLQPWPYAFFACALAGLATLWMTSLLQRWLGGYTGDCLGATQQVAELAFYLGLLARLPQHA